MKESKIMSCARARLGLWREKERERFYLFFGTLFVHFLAWDFAESNWGLNKYNIYYNKVRGAEFSHRIFWALTYKLHKGHSLCLFAMAYSIECSPLYLPEFLFLFFEIFIYVSNYCCSNQMLFQKLYSFFFFF